MGAMRKFLPYLSLLLLAVLVPVQAAGCCKWSALLSWAVPAPSQVAAQDLSGGMAPDHACCRKSAPAKEAPPPESHDCGSGSQGGAQGCCLKDPRLAGPALASEPASFSAGPALVSMVSAGESPRVAPLLPSSTRPVDTGPPPYLAHLRLLI